MNKAKKYNITLWILYALQAIPTIIWIVNQIDLFGDIFETEISHKISLFLIKTGFYYGSTEASFYRMVFSGFVMIAVMILILSVGAISKTLSFKDIGFIAEPYIVWGISLLLYSHSPSTDYGTHSYTAYHAVLLVIALCITVTQIYLIVKLSKATKQLKA